MRIRPADLEAAGREVATGKPFKGQHRKEIAEAARGLRRRIRQLNQVLENPSLSGAERQSLQDELSLASKDLDAAEDALSGIYRRHEQ